MGKKTFLALYDMERLNINPIEMLNEVYQESMQSYKSCRGMTDKGDPGAAYLAQALGAAKALAGYKHPTLTALAVKDMTELEEAAKLKPLTTRDAIEIIKNDPFNNQNIIKHLDLKQIPEKEISELPLGAGNKIDK